MTAEPTRLRRWLALASMPLVGRSYRGVLEHREYGGDYQSVRLDRWDCAHLHRSRRAAIACAVKEAERRWIVL